MNAVLWFRFTIFIIVAYLIAKLISSSSYEYGFESEERCSLCIQEGHTFNEDGWMGDRLLMNRSVSRRRKYFLAYTRHKQIAWYNFSFWRRRRRILLFNFKYQLSQIYILCSMYTHCVNLKKKLIRYAFPPPLESLIWMILDSKFTIQQWLDEF